MHTVAGEGHRLSPPQKRAWLLGQADGGKIRVVQCTVVITGALDVTLLRAALADVVQHREILRTSFRCVPGLAAPVQVIGSAEVGWETYVADDAAPERRAAGSEVDPGGMFERPKEVRIDCTSEPPLQARLCRLSSEQHRLRIRLPELCADRPSLYILLRELGHQYARLLNAGGGPAETIQYADLAEWQNQLLEDPAMAAGLAYWHEQHLATQQSTFLRLEPSPKPGPLPNPRKRMPAVHVDSVVRLEQIAEGLGGSVATYLLASWVVLLWRLGGCRQDVIIGVEVDGRIHEELHDVLGPMARRLPIRCHLDEDMPFAEVVAQLTSLLHDSQRWGEYFTWEDTFPSASAAVSFLPYAFDFVCYPSSFRVGELQFDIAEVDAPTDRFAINLFCSRDGNSLSIALQYDSQHVQEAEAVSLSERLGVLIERAAREPYAVVSSLDVLTSSDWELLASTNATQAAYPHTKCIHHLIEARAAITPDAVAVVFEDHRLSYGELNRRADRLAQHLRQLGVGPEVRVGICAERSPEMVLGLLGVLKTGGAYVPLDPTFPRERLAFMLADARARVLLTTGKTSGVASGLAAQVLVLEAGHGDCVKGAVVQEPVGTDGQARSENLAYVMYTSGSTGAPKGVEVEHRQIVHYVCAITDRLDLSSHATYAMVSTVAADLGNTILFGALCSGRQLHLISEEISLDPAALADYFRRHAIDCLKIAPSHLSAMYRSAPPSERVMPRRGLILGGEATRWEWVRELRDLAPGCTIFNHYGPTETTVGVLTYRIEHSSAALASEVPIGRPIANTRAYILDRHLRPVPTGTPGELHVGGAGVSRGYLGRSALTAERFIPDAFGSEVGGRLYRTGDLARHLPDGNLEFLGRVDHQVKVRGFRVELGEIEAALVRHPTVREAVAVLRDDRPGDPQLVAYVIPQANGVPPASELRAYLQEQLPDYMVPSAFVELAALPLTRNGKVNRGALPPPDPRHDQGRDGPALHTPVEEILAGIWEQVLGVQGVSSEDDFFTRGGNSLSGIQLVARIRDAFEVELSIRSLFEAPTLTELAKRIEAQLHAGPPHRSPPVLPVSRDGGVPLSFGQQRLWFLDQLEPGNPAYNVSRLLRLTGRLHVTALQRSFDEIVRRHEALRTTIAVADGIPSQCIASSLSVPLPVVDLSGLPEVEREIELGRQVREELARPFDLARGPLVRVHLFRLGEEVHVLTLSMHHIISDDWSMTVFAREAMVLYEAFSAGKLSPLPELQVQYADVASWQRQRLGDVLEAQRSYWMRELGGTLPTLGLPTDRSRAPTISLRGEKQSRQFPKALSDAVKALSHQQGATLFMTLLTAFYTLLHRITDQTDIVVGSPIANRDLPHTEELIGFFVNFLALRCDLSGNPTFLDLLGRVRRVALDAYVHRDLPFEMLVEELQPARDVSRTPLFQVSFVLENVPRPVIELSGLSVSPLDVDSGTSKLDLHLSMVDTEQGLIASAEYNNDLFCEETIASLLRHFQTLLDGIVTNPQQRLASVPLLTAAERHELLVRWNDTRGAYPRDRCLHELFEAQAAQTPDAIAVTFEDQNMTYAQLNRCANRLAHRLQALGVGPEVRVGICLERSVALVVSVLGILKAGGAYVPLDPAYPTERLSLMLADAQVPVLVTREQSGAGLFENDGMKLEDRRPLLNPPASSLDPQIKVVHLDTDWQTIASESEENPVGGATADNLAYVIYTSGSAGQPKGVLVAHGGLCNLAEAQIQAFNVQVGDRILQFSSVSFDASIFETIMALRVGATLCLGTRDSLMPGPALSRLLHHKGITHVTLPPSALAALPQEELPLLRTIIAAGEACSADLVGRWAIGRRFFNAYGPTEATVWASVAECIAGCQRPTIGRPIANMQIYLLDSALQPVPIGLPGELHIGGVGLARGYLNRPDQTAEKFIPNPFGTERPGHDTLGARLYKTGDLARYLPGGHIEFLGRIDYQVKLRGFRVEPGEIEAVLGQHPAVQASAVGAQEYATGDKRLIAYVVPDPQVVPDWHSPDRLIADVRHFLTFKLPVYMVPAAFVLLETLPLTPNGKVDRRALPDPHAARPKLEETLVAPRSPIEETLAQIWADVLGLEQVGVYESFFVLGGHSLLATQLVSRLRDTFNVELPLRYLFDSPTVADVAAHVEALRRTEHGPSQSRLSPAPRQAGLPLSLAQEQLWTVEQVLPGNAFFNINTAFHLRGLLDVSVLTRSLNAIIGRHEALRTTFAQDDGRPIQVIAPSLRLTIPVISLERLTRSEQQLKVQRLVEEEEKHPFDLSTGPLLRATLVRLANDDHVVLLTMHHIITDGWSMGILRRELTVLYEAFSTQQASPLPALPLQFADFAYWQRELLRQGRFDMELSYWKRRLANCSEPMQWSTGRAQTVPLSFRTKRYSAAFPTALVDNLRALSHREGSTLFMTVLAAFKALLHRYSGLDDIRVGTLVANRNLTELEGIIGCFMNTFVLRTDVSEDPTLHELLHRVRETTLEAYIHGNLPFEELLRNLHGGQEGTALFQVMFLLEDLSPPHIQLPRLTVDPFQLDIDQERIGLTATTFDLVLRMEPNSDGMVGTLIYKADLFGVSTAADMLSHLRQVLECFVVQPECWLSSIPLSPELTR